MNYEKTDKKYYIRFKDPDFGINTRPSEITDRQMVILMKMYIWQERNKEICPFGFFPYRELDIENKLMESAEGICEIVNRAVELGILERISENTFFETVYSAVFETKTAVEETQNKREQSDIIVEGCPVFMCRSSQVYRITQSKLDELKKKYPTVDANRELNMAKKWLDEFPTKRKSVGGMPKFLDEWFGRAKDRYPTEDEKKMKEKEAEGRAKKAKRPEAKKPFDNKGREVL